MTGTRGRRSIRRVMVTCVAVLALASGCGDESTPGEAVPALADRLERVDQAIEAGDYVDARAQLDRLAAEAAQADAAGEISEEQADRILEAVEAVLAGLPPAEDGEGSPPADPTPEPEAPADDGDPDDDEDKDKDEDEDKEENKDKDDKKDEKDKDKDDD